MTDISPKPLLLRLAVYCVLAFVLWTSFVKPARADLDSKRSRLDIQKQEVADHAQRADSATTDLQERAAAIRAIALALQDELKRHVSTKRLLTELETFAKQTDVTINRTESYTPEKLSVPIADDQGAIQLLAERFTVRFSASYSNSTAFVSRIQSDLGITSIDALRLVPTASGQINAAIDFKVFRLAPKSSEILPDKDTSQNDD